MRCANCGTENAGSAKFCEGCGAPLARRCSSCGATHSATARFCPECGTALFVAGTDRPIVPGSASPAPAEPASDVVAERRVCSVLFCDLVGFTTLSETRDPEEVRELLSRYFEVARRTVTRYGGIVEKFIGDAVMAVWGTPVAQEGDTERSVRAALDLVDAVAVLGQEAGTPGLAARAGVVTDEVAVTLGAQGQGMVAGDAVNTASRVQSVAKPGTVLVDEATRKLSEPAITFSDEGNFSLKGKAEPVPLFSATRVVSGVGGKQRAGGLEAPFTGRDAELRGLKDLFHTCVERKAPRLVVVTGAAGVGKSRLGWELEKYIDGLADTILWHRGRCLSYGDGVAFWALAEIVRQRFGIKEEDPKEVAEIKLKEGMVRFVEDHAERDYVGVRLSRLLGVSYPSETKTVLTQDELYAGWRLFFGHLAQVAPVALLVEDAQHADEGLLGFIEHLVDWTRDLPVFVLLFARPGHPQIDAGYGVGRNRSTLSLDPLDPASMGALVDALVPGIPAGARDAITERAQGVPLFAAETVRSLIDHGIVAKDDDSYRLAGDLRTLTVPESLHALLAARLDALSPGLRALVADAAVVGTTFPAEALLAVSTLEPEEVAAGLSELVRRDVFEVNADPLSPERGAFRFSQEMLRQVAYETLSRKDRKARHLAAAAHLRAAFADDGEEIADAIARHYLDALASGPTDADSEEIQADALSFLVRAAQRAARSGAPSRAAELYVEAARVAPPERAPSLLEEAAEASTDAGDDEAALVHAQAAREGHLALGDPRGAARSQSIAGSALGHLGSRDAERGACADAVAALREPPDADTVVALRRLAACETMAGNAAEGRRLVTEALDLAQGIGVGTLDLSRLFNVRGLANAVAGRLAEAVGDRREAARLAERAGDSAALGMAQLNLADILVRTDPRAAADAARSATTHLRRTGQRGRLSVAVANLAMALIELGEWDEAATVFHDALEADHLEDWTVHATAGWLAGLRGDGGGTAAAQGIAAHRRATDDPQDQSTLDFLDALAALCAGDVAGALAQAMRTLEKATVIGIGADAGRWAWPLAARAARSLGERATVEHLILVLDAHPAGHVPPILRAERQLVIALSAADDEPPGSGAVVPAVVEAVASLRDVGNPYQLAHGLVDLAEVLARAGEDGAEEALAEGSAIADRVGCPPLLARAASVTSLYAPAGSPI